MASQIPYSVADDKDLDDAALWAVIDTAAASHSSSKSRKPLAIKYPNFQPVSPISNPAPPTKFTRNPRTPNFADSDLRISSEGEVVQEPWIYRPPRKVARTCASVVSESSPLLVVRNVQRTPTTPAYSSPEAHLSPDIERFGVKEISARSEGSPGRCGWSEDLNMRHSLSGRFPSVSLFKEYQNAAMAAGGRYHSISISLLKSKIRQLNLMRTVMFSVLNLWFGHTCKVVGSQMDGAHVSGVRRGS
ncbi:hypothetical protein I3760_09G191300 [Carya illinoinensis]|nr:hypothetical protein I3760_09G191300 [Carya illinoinensis]